ncbi:MAG TPA: universal stress protein [Gemmataceae bacterium]|nr:universal stress protein [Gemmataceae bacterium]
MQHFRTILHPTDFSAAADAAFGVACSLSQALGARLILLHCLPTPVTAIGGTQALPPPPDEPERREALDKLQAALRSVGTLHGECKVTVGEAANEILRLAQETPCDLIAMGTHGRSGVARLLLGSVAEAVLRKASCPVLTVKAT